MRSAVLWSLLLGLLLIQPAALAAQEPDPLQLQRAVIQRLVQDVYNEGNVSVVDELFAESYVLYPAETDRTAFKNRILSLRSAMPDFQAQTVLLIAEENRVALHLALSGTLVNELVFPDSVPIPPTGEVINMVASSVFVFNQEGRIVEEWTAFDNLTFLMGIGAAPPIETWVGPTEPLEVPPAPPVVAHESIATVFVQAISGQDFIFIEQSLSEDFVAYSPFGALSAAEYIQDLQAFRTAFPDLTITVEAMVAQGDSIAVLYTLRDTFTGEFRYGEDAVFSPTNQSLELLTVAFFQFDVNSRILEIRELYDSWHFLVELDLLPRAPEGTP